MARCVISKTETEEAVSDRRHDRLDLGRHHRCAGDDRPFGLGVAQQRAESDFQDIGRLHAITDTRVTNGRALRYRSGETSRFAQCRVDTLLPARTSVLEVLEHVLVNAQGYHLLSSREAWCLRRRRFRLF